MGEAGVTRASLRRAASRVALALGFALTVCLAGCGRGAHREPGAARDSTGTHAEGGPVGRTDPVLNAARPEFEEWAAMWRAALPGFALDSLYATPAGAFHPDAVTEFTPDHADSMAPRNPFAIFSPDRARLLIVDVYRMEDEGGEPDSAPMLVDFASRRLLRFDFCGTPCGYHWGRWLGPDRFALAGWQDSDDGAGKEGRISIYSLADSSRITWVTRVVPERVFASYLETWTAWVAKRTRELRTRRPNA